jgi:hypothetical protein
VKIEIGESLIYSWLKHIKECQLVQTNWKCSPNWELQNYDEIETVMKLTDEYFNSKYSLSIYKETKSIEQLIKQAEIDAIGILYSNQKISLYCVDIAFHENGLNYGSADETVSRIIKKTIRTAMCLIGYFGTKNGEIYFVSPKINNAIEQRLLKIIPELEKLIQSIGWSFQIKLLCNQAFGDKIINPVINIANEVADTGELFIRSIQLKDLFYINEKSSIKSIRVIKESNEVANKNTIDLYSEMKIGAIARTALRSLLESNIISKDCIEKMQTLEYSKQNFGLQYPLLKKVDRYPPNKVERYYADPIRINSDLYYLCSEWYEQKNNNDRPYLIKWMKENSV